MPLGNRRPSRDTDNGSKRDMRGKLWPNNRRDNPKSPDYTGVATIDGRDYRVSAWNGDRDDTVSLSFKIKTEDRREHYVRLRDSQEPISDYNDRNPPPSDWDR